MNYTKIINLKQHWPLFLSSGIFLILTAYVLNSSLNQNAGHFIYALDDAYIHMAMAKNTALYGVWGIDQYNFSSSSSSPLWTLMLALVDIIFGVNELSPFIINICCALLILLAVYLIFKENAARPGFIFGVLLAVIFFTPLIPLIFCGMEHVLQILLVSIFVYLSTKLLVSPDIISKKNYFFICSLAALLTVTRYECIFLVIIVGMLFMLKKKFLLALLLGISSLLPISIYGIISLIQGWYILPNSVMLKGRIFEFLSFMDIVDSITHAFRYLLATPQLLYLFIGALCMGIGKYIKTRKIWSNSMSLIIIFLAAVLMHLQFVSVGWFYRYEAYLIALGIITLAFGVRDDFAKFFLLPSKARQISNFFSIKFFIFFLIFIFLSFRAGEAITYTPQATTNIYEQQYQIGLFLKDFYPDKIIAANDIGALSYLAQVKVIDLYGLGNMSVAEWKKQGNYHTAQIEELIKKENVDIAVLYKHWYNNEAIGGLPAAWMPVGEWKIKNNIICGGDTVTFYAVNPSSKDALIRNLQLFSSRLPKTIEQTGEYILK